MADLSGSFDVKSIARGPHWIAWIVRPGSDRPEHGIVLVGATQDEAEARARAWASSPFHSQT
jgi:hypothetical protein